MVIINELSDAAAWNEWVDSRPQIIKEMIASHPPSKLYRMKTTGQRCEIISYSEDRTVTVDISGTFNFLLFGRQVYGVDIDDLEECDLPPPGEHVGDMSLILHDTRINKSE